MNPQGTADRFKQLLPTEKTFAAGLDVMLQFYENERVDGTCLDQLRRTRVRAPQS